MERAAVKDCPITWHDMAITYLNSHLLRLPTQYSHEIKKNERLQHDCGEHPACLTPGWGAKDHWWLPREGQSLFYASVGDSPHTLLWKALIESDGLFLEEIWSWVEMGDRSGTSPGRWGEGMGVARVYCIHAWSLKSPICHMICMRLAISFPLCAHTGLSNEAWVSIWLSTSRADESPEGRGWEEPQLSFGRHHPSSDRFSFQVSFPNVSCAFTVSAHFSFLQGQRT